MARILRGLIWIYRMVVSPMLGPNCRFEPSCSQYAIDALQAHGALRGSGLAARRVLRCNPWHPGGFDPVLPAQCGCSPSPSGTLAR